MVGTISAARLPQFTGGDVTTSASGSVSLILSLATVTRAHTTITGTPDGTKFLRDDWTWQTVSGGGPIGGATGSTDNSVLRADGAGGATIQASGIVIDDATASTAQNVTIANADPASNSSLVLSPKGTGAFILGPKPDGTATGGNARGTYAVDLQYGSRSTAAQVASGSYSTVAGYRNTASSNFCIAMGNGNTAATGNSSTVGVAIGGGNTINASSLGATLIGVGNTCTGVWYPFAYGGYNTVNAQNSVGLGFRTTITHSGCVVVGANDDGAVSSDRVKQFKVRADGGITHQTDGGTRTDYGKRSSAPGSPVAGDRYYDTTTNKERVYNGSTWNDLF